MLHSREDLRYSASTCERNQREERGDISLIEDKKKKMVKGLIIVSCTADIMHRQVAATNFRCGKER